MLDRVLANELLAKFNLDVDDLLAEAPEIVGDGALMLIGSVADGFGTPMSDVDLMVVGERRPDSDLVLREAGRERAIRVLGVGQEINIEYWDVDRLSVVAKKFAKTKFSLDNPKSTDEIVIFSNQELRTIHYLVNGLLIDGNRRVFENLFDKDTLVDYLIMYSATCHLAFAEDSIGQIMVGDLQCASLHLRMAMEFLIGAEIASLGYTQPYLRWRLKFLRECRVEIGEEVYERYISYMFPERSTTKEGVEGALKFAQERLAVIFMRRPRVLIAAGALSERMKFVTSFGA